MKLTAVVKSAHPVLWFGCFIFLLALSACSTGETKSDIAYREAKTMPELQIPGDLQQPGGNRSLMEVPEELDTGEIPKDLDKPPTVTGINLEEEEEPKASVSADDEDAVPVEKKLQSKIVYQSDNTQLLAVKSDIDTVWPRVEKAIKKIGFTIDDSNRGKFYYTVSRQFERVKTVLDPSQPVEMDLETPKEEHMIYVEPGEEYIEITVRNLQSKIEGTVLANQLLLQLKGYIEEP